MFKFTTLIVEDNESFRHSLNEILSTRFPSMTIVEAGNANSVPEQVESLVPDLVLMDIKLPDGNGLSLTRSIKADHADTIVIVITAYDLPEYRHAAFQAGASYFIPKGSFVDNDILSLIESIVNARIAAQSLFKEV